MGKDISFLSNRNLVSFLFSSENPIGRARIPPALDKEKQFSDFQLERERFSFSIIPLSYFINIASPKLKNRYLSFTASS